MNTPNQPPPIPQSNAQNQALESDAGMRFLLPVGRSGWAIAAGYLGLLSFVILPAPIALIISIFAIIDIKKSKGTEAPKYGMGRAIFGLIMGMLGTACLSYVLIGNLLAYDFF